MLGARLKALREQKEISQRELAKVLKISPSTIAMYELEQRKPDNDMLQNIADFFSVSTDFLLGRTTNLKISKIDEDNPQIDKAVREIKEALWQYVVDSLIDEEDAIRLLQKAAKQLELDVELLNSQKKASG